MYVCLKIALNIQINVSKQALFILICMLTQVYVLLLTRFAYVKYSFNKCLEL